ncbi:MAG: acetyl-CoA carboxylase carboxyltransferase subunit alpha [Acidobacteriota bacterium]|nr:acetyl-CoA carboxylase carboxyltransferase subunit alpha [Thermoanaerobaculaceae bacterium]
MQGARDFDAKIREIEEKIEQIKFYDNFKEKEKELKKLEKELKEAMKEVYSKLTPWQTVQVARNPKRPQTLDIIKALFDDFVEFHGDRRFGDDTAIICGFAKFEGINCAVIGHQKGHDTKERAFRNFGMPKPEGYRKALRIMKLAEKFSLPVLTFIDTPGAYPGMDAEERGQAEAIAVNLREMADLETIILATVTGEGGSGGALAIGVADRVNILKYAVYSVISPEGCAAILYKDAGKADVAAQSLKLTAKDLLSYGLVDRVIDEPEGGAHYFPEIVYENIKNVLREELRELKEIPIPELVRKRKEKFYKMGAFREE